MMYEQRHGYGSVICIDSALTHLTCKCEFLTGYKGCTNISNMRTIRQYPTTSKSITNVRDHEVKSEKVSNC